MPTIKEQLLEIAFDMFLAQGYDASESAKSSKKPACRKGRFIIIFHRKMI